MEQIRTHLISHQKGLESCVQSLHTIEGSSSRMGHVCFLSRTSVPPIPTANGSWKLDFFFLGGRIIFFDSRHVVMLQLRLVFLGLSILGACVSLSKSEASATQKGHLEHDGEVQLVA